MEPQELLETSFQEIVLHGEAFVAAFYERLFTRFPQIQPFFSSTDMPEQRKKLQESLSLIVTHMRHPEKLDNMLKALGQRHVSYGIRPEHYSLVGVVLLETFADFLGKHWTQAHHDIWVQGYESVSHLMQQDPESPPLP